MKQILVGLDPSPGALEVLRSAVDLAAATGARVSLMRVIEGAGAEPELSGILRSAAREDLRELASVVPPSRLDCLYARIGTAWEELSEAARHADADLVVIGAGRHGPLRRALGTTAAKVVNHCDRSVLVVREWRGPLARFLVALDESEHGVIVRDYAVELARRTRVKLRLFRAIEQPARPDTPRQEAAPRDDPRRAAHEALYELARLVPPELLDGVSAASGATAWSSICTAAREFDVDVAIVGAHAHRLTDGLLGTTAARVADHADRSVLVVKHPWRESSA